MSNIFLHIGFPKTATTTLQSVLKAHEGCVYLGKGLREKAAPNLSLRIAYAALYLDHFRFQEALPSLREEIVRHASEAPVMVISDETFAFAEYMFLGKHWPDRPLADHEMVAGRLAQIIPGAGILMSIREQVDFLKSFYRQTVKRDEETRPLLEFLQNALDDINGRSILHPIRYDEAYQAYARHFGSDRIYFSLYEKYRKDFGMYLEEISEIIGVDHNRLKSDWGGRHANPDRPRRQRESVKRARQFLPKVLTSRISPDLKRSILGQLARPAPSMELDDGTVAAIKQYYARPNRVLSDWTGLDLAANGYAVANQT